MPSRNSPFGATEKLPFSPPCQAAPPAGIARNLRTGGGSPYRRRAAMDAGSIGCGSLSKQTSTNPTFHPAGTLAENGATAPGGSGPAGISIQLATIRAYSSVIRNSPP